ncbi:hypothetical protein BJ508DRAFT_309733 [Ascobolus immersus RN42]|uniref:Uncharacterized protein n=1 Tax=Ascobolus immersus RN42 TaxID=1160509 RepID=A0A3N4HXS4_ASCIM|nr:hypothetical protein BJ508DRAFT_309733 [Ascobolus immersus RN42]
MTKSRRLFDALFDLCLSRSQRERHNQYVFDQAVKRSSPDSTPFVTCQNTPVQSRAPSRAHSRAPSRAASRMDDSLRDRDGFGDSTFTSPISPITSPPQSRYGYSTFSPKQHQDLSSTPNYQKPSQLASGYFGNITISEEEEGKQQIEQQPLLYPIYPIKMQGIGRYRRSANVSETFIDTMLKDRFPTLERTERPEADPTSPVSATEERGHNRRDSEISYISTASSGCVTVDTDVTEPSVLMSPMSPGGRTERRDSRGERLSGNFNTTTPSVPHMISPHDEGLEIVEDIVPNEIVQNEDGTWVLYKDVRPPVPVVRQAAPRQNGGRFGRLPPPPAEMEFETDDDSDDEPYVPPQFLSAKKPIVKSPAAASSAAVSIPTPKAETPAPAAAESFESVSSSSSPPPKPTTAAPPVPKRPQMRRGRRAATTSRLPPARRTTVQNVLPPAASGSAQAMPAVVRRNTANAVPSDRVVGAAAEQVKPQVKRSVTGKGLARRGGGRARGKVTAQQMDTLVEGRS